MLADKSSQGVLIKLNMLLLTLIAMLELSQSVTTCTQSTFPQFLGGNSDVSTISSIDTHAATS